MEVLYRNSPTLFRTAPPPTPYGLLFPILGVHNSRPITIISETGKAWTSNLAGTFKGASEQKPLKLWRKGSVGVSMDCPYLFISPISGTGLSTNFKFCTHIRRIDVNKSPLKISGKVALRDFRNFSGHPYRVHCAVIFCDSSAFLLFNPADLVKLIGLNSLNRGPVA